MLHEKINYFINPVVTFATHMTTNEYLILSASKKDMPTVELLAKGLDLDCEDLDWPQFIVAKRKNKIIGFGRLRKYNLHNRSEEYFEIATVGVLAEEREKGLGSAIVKELIRRGPPEIFVTCVIPVFFEKLGFHLTKQYPSVLQKKVDFCKSYDFKNDQIFVMKLVK